MYKSIIGTAMFIFVLTYQKPLAEVEKHIDAHKEFLDINYKLGHFIASGRQEPRVGGIILCKANNKDEALKLSQNDPFFIHGIAKYNIIEFIPTKYASGFDQFI